MTVGIKPGIPYHIQLWPSIKTVKAKIVALMHDTSTVLKTYGEKCDTSATFAKDCAAIVGKDDEVCTRAFLRRLGESSLKFFPDAHFLFSQLAKFASSDSIAHNTARKDVFLSISRGLAKIADGKRPVIQVLPTASA